MKRPRTQALLGLAMSSIASLLVLQGVASGGAGSPVPTPACWEDEDVSDQPPYRPVDGDSVQDLPLSPPVASLDSIVVTFDPAANVVSVTPVEGESAPAFLDDSAQGGSDNYPCLPAGTFYSILLDTGDELFAGGPGVMTSWRASGPGEITLVYSESDD